MENVSINADAWEVKQRFLDVPYNTLRFHEVIAAIEGVKHTDGFFYIVTPNVDHAVRLRGDNILKNIYEQSWLSLCDSKPISWMAKSLSFPLPLVTGSDLTACLFHEVIQPGDRVTLIAPYEEVAQRMMERFPDVNITYHVPPRNVITNEEAMRACAEFAARDEPNFIFIAVGSPQSELIAYEISHTAGSTGVCICCGASLEFITNLQTRAPFVMQKFGFEWLYRLMSDPRRLWRRYVYAVPPLVRMFAAEAMMRSKSRQRARSEKNIVEKQLEKPKTA
jgi:exopolysaccharide biosynthesis WecB/TagA/CpsF family protein